ncbi:MAG: type II toxin-antitoxin system RelE/ParE family toxin [Planctomycetia bacterium]|nr:type II toxin-antitoxin system RelE/ParE family toxin [Planctomycetia bacterium]
MPVVNVAERAKKYLKKLPENSRKKILQHLQQLEISGLKLNHVKQLTGNLDQYYRLRIGEYRAIFYVEKDTFYVVAILHRKDSYREK